MNILDDLVKCHHSLLLNWFKLQAQFQETHDDCPSHNIPSALCVLKCHTYILCHNWPCSSSTCYLYICCKL
ncbi:hypothetical protein E2C01_052285 [Portunus trituberculatus]|uniref:Uncharacterized protein n=1 Tax=Portunus trituberculatus TaxID=210409 RepID=A0A5B7GL52_PORTR|nr:hypothetical protein [Portunus trituberculatus]